MKNFLKPTDQKIKLAILILLLAPFPFFYIPIPFGYSIVLILFIAGLFDEGNLSYLASFLVGSIVLAIVAYLIACLVFPLFDKQSRLQKFLGFVLGMLLFSSFLLAIYWSGGIDLF